MRCDYGRSEPVYRLRRLYDEVREFDAIHLNRELPEASRMYKSEDKMKAILPYAAKRAIKIKFKRKK